MLTSKHVEGCNKIADELADSLTGGEVKKLTRLLSAVMLEDWFAWRERNDDLISAFVAAAPSQRKKTKGWNKDPETKLYLTLAGYQHCMEAKQMMLIVYVQQLCKDAPARDVACRAGIAYRAAIRDPDLRIWPYDHPPPFSDWGE